MEESIPSKNQGNLQDYEKALKEFTWSSVDKEFDWSSGGPYNVAREAIDRHAQNWRKNKIALYSITANNEVRKYTFGEMAELTSGSLPAWRSWVRSGATASSFSWTEPQNCTWP